VTKGTRYYFQVGTPLLGSTPSNGGSGLADITLTIFPNRYTVPNDFLPDATTVSFAAGSGAIKNWQGMLNGATVEAWEPTDNPDKDVSNSDPQLRDGTIWYKFTPPQTGLITLTACTPLDRPTVAVFSTYANAEGAGVGYGDLKSIAFDGNNDPGSCAPLELGASVSFAGLQGETYYLQVSHTTGYTPSTAYYVDLSMQGAFFFQPYIDKLNHTSGHVGSTITITGQALNAGTPVVKFGTKTATILTSPAPTFGSITVKVPSLPKGTYQVTVTNTTPNPDDVSNKVSFKVT
jgi:hypothetical protein